MVGCSFTNFETGPAKIIIITIEITTDNGKYKLSGENSADFPKEPTADGVDEVKLASSVLNKGVSKTLFAVSNDELRPAMTGVFFQLDENGITFVATDAHRLHRRHSLPSRRG